MKRYRAGVIGLGHIGMLYELDENTRRRYPHPSHTSAYAAHHRIELIAGCDAGGLGGPVVERLDVFAQRYPTARAYKDVETMLKHEELEIVSVCVPPSDQTEVVDRLVDAGVPMIFCEKPFGTMSRAGRSRAVVTECRKKGIGLVVNYWRRFDESHQHIASLITQGRLGTLQHIQGYYGNGLLRNASHLINLWLWYAGPIEWVLASPEVAEPSWQDGNVNVLFGFANGARGSLAAVSCEAYRLIEVDLLGTEGRISMKNEGLDLKVFGVQPNEEVSGARQLTHDGEMILSTVGTAMDRAVEALVKWLDQGERPVADDAIQTLAVLEAIQRSLIEEGRKVFVEAHKPVVPAQVVG